MMFAGNTHRANIDSKRLLIKNKLKTRHSAKHNDKKQNAQSRHSAIGPAPANAEWPILGWKADLEKSYAQ